LTEQLRNLLVIKLNSASSELPDVSFKTFIDLPENEINELKTLLILFKMKKRYIGCFHNLRSYPLIIESVVPSITLEVVLLRAATTKVPEISVKELLAKIDQLERKGINITPQQERTQAQNKEHQFLKDPWKKTSFKTRTNTTKYTSRTKQTR